MFKVGGITQETVGGHHGGRHNETADATIPTEMPCNGTGATRLVEKWNQFGELVANRGFFAASDRLLQTIQSIDRFRCPSYLSKSRKHEATVQGQRVCVRQTR